MRIAWLPVLLAAAPLRADTPGPLPQSRLWDFPATIVEDQYRELRGFYERQILDAAAGREAFGRNPPEVQRKVLRELTGVVDQPLSPVPLRVSLGDTADYRAYLVSWPVLRLGNTAPTRGSAATLVRCYGILLEPASAGKRAAVIAIPDATQSAADIAGLTGRLPLAKQISRQLASAGYEVFTPFFTERRAFPSPGSRIGSG